MKVLVPLDGTRRALQVLPVVTWLSRDDATVLLLTVGEVPDSVQHAKELRAELSRMLQEAAEVLPSRRVETRVELTGHPEETIADVAQEQEVDLIVMATPSAPLLARLARRSVPDAVLRRVRIPMTLVPLPKDFEE